MELKQKEHGHVMVSALRAALGTLASRVLGFLRDMIIAHFFSRSITDAFVVAFRLPNLFRRILGEGALTVSFVPILSDFLKNEDNREAREFISAIFTLLFVILSVLTAVGILGARPLVGFLARGEGFLSVPGKLDLTIHQSRIMFGYILLVSLYSFAMGILNTLRIFWLPAFAPAVWNISMILGIAFFRNYFYVKSDILAWATLVGGIAQVGILIPSLVKHQFLPRFRKWWGQPEVGRFIKALGPGILGLSAMQLTVLVNTYFASRLQEGSNSWIYWADRILELPLSLFAVSLGIAALPTYSLLWAKGDSNALSEVSLQGLKLSFFLALPCALGLFIYAFPIVHALFEHGQFTSVDAHMTASIVRIYGFGIVFAAAVRVLAPVFYAMKNFWIPSWASALSLVAHIVIAIVLVKYSGVEGLALSSVISGFINFAFLFLFYGRVVGFKAIRQLLKPISRILAAGTVMAFISIPLVRYGPFMGDTHLLRAIALILGISLSALVYFVASAILGVNEISELLEVLKNRSKEKI